MVWLLLRKGLLGLTVFGYLWDQAGVAPEKSDEDVRRLGAYWRRGAAGQHHNEAYDSAGVRTRRLPLPHSWKFPVEPNRFNCVSQLGMLFQGAMERLGMFLTSCRSRRRSRS